MRPTFSGRRTAPARAWAPAVLAALAIAGCTRALVEVAPPVTMASAFSSSGSALLPDRWWEAFGDAALDAVMADALAGNLTLQGAWDRLDAAQAVAARSGAALWPEAGGDAGAGRSAAKSAGLDRTYTNQVGVGLSASYELDLWGRVRATRDAAILDDQIETNEKYLQVVQSRFRAGQTAGARTCGRRSFGCSPPIGGWRPPSPTSFPASPCPPAATPPTSRSATCWTTGWRTCWRT